MCEVTPYMVSVTTKRGLSVVYHSLLWCISYIPQFSMVYQLIQLYTTVWCLIDQWIHIFKAEEFYFSAIKHT